MAIHIGHLLSRSAARRPRGRLRRARSTESARGRRRYALSDVDGGVPAGAGAIGMERRPKRAGRHPLGHCQRRRRSQARGRNGCVRPRCHPGLWRLDRGAVAAGARTVPIVFAIVADPVGAGFVESLARPGGNTTGFMAFEYGIAIDAKHEKSNG
jgi:hypothetical protein